MTDAEQIAAGLTAAQREAILHATDAMSSHGGWPFFIVKRTADYWPQGVCRFLSVTTDRLTPLGLAVRARLQETQQ